MSLARVRAWYKAVPLGLIWGLVWPQTMMMMCTMTIGLTDMWVAGRLNSEIQAAIGLSNQLMAFFMVLGAALGAASMAAVSQSFGANKKKRGQRYAGFVIVMAVGMALVLAMIGWAGRGGILAILQVPDELRPQTLFFFNIILLGLPAQYVMGMGGTLFRATRNVMMPLLITGVACLVNVIGSLGFGLGWFGFPTFGAAGIGWSTFGAMCVAALMTVILLGRCHLFLPGIVPPLRWMRKAAPYLFKVAIPSVITQFLWQTGYLTLYAIVGALPHSVTALAGMTAGMRIESMLFMPAMAFNVTASILVGNALGAGDKAGAKRIALATIVCGAVLMSLVGAFMWPWMPELAAMFSDNEEARWHIVAYLTYNILSTPFTVGGMILTGVMTGAGATIYALVINTSCVWLVRLPLGWLLAHTLGYGARGMYIAMLISMAVQASCMMWVFFRRNWTKYAMNQGESRHSGAAPGVSRESAQSA